MSQLVDVYLSGLKLKISVTMTPDTVTVNSSYNKDLVSNLKSFQGSKYNPTDKSWSFANNSRNRFSFRFLTRKYTEAQSRYFSPIPQLAQNLKIPLWAHQKEMFDFGSFRRRVILAAEPRTGKTLPSLLIFTNSNAKVCNFITTSSAYLGIMREVKKWFDPNELSVVESLNPEYLNDLVNRPNLFNRRVINLFTYSGFKKLSADNAKDCSFWVFDELHKMKEDTSIRSNFGIDLSYELESIYGGDEYIIGLTGTPSPRDPSDWWMQSELIRPGFIREGDRKKFKSRYALWDTTEGVEYPKIIGWNEKELSALTQRLSPMVRVYLQKDVIDLPAVIHEVIRLEPTKEMNRIAAVYKRTISNSMSLRAKLHQLSDGFSYITDYDEVTCKIKRNGFSKIESPKESQIKLDLEDLISDEGTARAVVYAAFQASVDIITDVALELGYWVLKIDGRGKQLIHNCAEGTVNNRIIESDQSVIISTLDEMDRTTNTYRIKKLVTVAETEAGGTGLEFSASSIIIYYSNSDVGEGKMQSWRRAYSANMDTVKGLTLREYYCLPIDEAICEKHAEKSRLQNITMTFDKV